VLVDPPVPVAPPLAPDLPPLPLLDPPDPTVPPELLTPPDPTLPPEPVPGAPPEDDEPPDPPEVPPEPVPPSAPLLPPELLEPASVAVQCSSTDSFVVHRPSDTSSETTTRPGAVQSRVTCGVVWSLSLPPVVIHANVSRGDIPASTASGSDGNA
jgi:hypothetical protein